MDATRVFLWFVGVVLVLGALFLLFVETGLNQWVSWTIFGAGLLLLLGLFVLGLSRSRQAGEEGTHVTKVE